MSRPEIDPDTAASELEDADFADEHTKPTYDDEPALDPPDESAPTGQSGMESEDEDQA